MAGDIGRLVYRLKQVILMSYRLVYVHTVSFLQVCWIVSWNHWADTLRTATAIYNCLPRSAFENSCRRLRTYMKLEGRRIAQIWSSLASYPNTPTKVQGKAQIRITPFASSSGEIDKEPQHLQFLLFFSICGYETPEFRVPSNLRLQNICVYSHFSILVQKTSKTVCAVIKISTDCF